MVAAANNPFPSILTVEGTTPSTPAAGQQRLFVRSSDHVLCYVNSSGTVTAVSTGLTNPMTTKGDIIQADTGGTPTRLAAGTSGQVLTSGGAAAFSAWATPAGSSLTHAVANRTAGDYTTTSDTFVDTDATNLKLTIVTGAHSVRIRVRGAVNNSNNSGAVAVDVTVDGTRVGQDLGLTAPLGFNANLNFPIAIDFLTVALSAASHEFRVQWRRTGGSGTATMYGSTTITSVQFSVEEQPF